MTWNSTQVLKSLLYVPTYYKLCSKKCFRRSRNKQVYPIYISDLDLGKWLFEITCVLRSEKATKFEEVLTLLTYLPLSFVAFSENLNFEYVPVLTRQFFTDINLDRLYIGQVNVIGIDLWQFGLWGLQIWECRLGIVSIKEGLNTVIGGTSKLTTEPYTSNYIPFVYIS